MDEQTISRSTGKTAEQWHEVIRGAGLAEASHKEIAGYLHDRKGLSYWWAQEITVEYERAVGRRTVGQTGDGFYQIGVSKTVGVPVSRLWSFVDSSEGVSLIAGGRADGFEDLDERAGSGDLLATTTTYQPGSHVRMRWRAGDWPEYSILQVRVTAKGEAKTTLSFHHERLPSQEAREAMRRHWKDVAEKIASTVRQVG